MGRIKGQPRGPYADLSDLTSEQKRDRKTAQNRQWKRNNHDRARQHAFDGHERLKKEVFDAYGGRCQCCDESDLHFLTIDHIDGVVPPSHRHPNGRRLGGRALLYRLRKEGFPDICRVLCWNCNCAHAYYGFCPHQPHTSEQRRYK